MKNKMLSRQSEAEVNMTPMLDIVFIMLIFFIVASTFIRESGLDVTQQQDKENKIQQVAKNRVIYVQICGNDQINVDGRGIDIRSVRANVEAKLAKEPQSVVIVETAQQASTGSLVMVMDQAIAAKASVSIAPESIECLAAS